MKAVSKMMSILLLWCIVRVQTDEFTDVTPIQPTTIFQPFGKVVNQYTYANIRVHINITSLFEEVEQLCYASKLLKHAKKTISNSGSSRKLVHMLTDDLIEACNQNTRKLQALTKTFGFKKIKIPDYASAFNNGSISNKREKRQLIIGGIIAITSILSIYSVSQLIDMATSNDDELVTQTNHIINAIEDHENRIIRHDDDIKRLFQHINKLEDELIIAQDLQMVVARIFSIKTQGISIQNHLNGIEIGLYNLLKGQLTPYLISVETIQKGLDKLRNTVVKKGYLLSTFDGNEALQLQSSFVSFTNGSIMALLHIPIYRAMSTLYIYRYVPIPISSSDNGSALLIEPDETYIAVSLKDELYVEIHNTGLEHDCKYIKDTFFCKGNVLKKGNHNSCLHALYKNEISKIGDSCPVKLYTGEEYVVQLNSTTFVTYGKTPSRMYIICTDQDGQKIYERSLKLTGTNYLKIYKNCDITLRNHFLSSGLPFAIDLNSKMIVTELHVKELVSLGESEMNHFLNFVKKGLKSEKESIHLSTAKQKFDLKIIKHRNTLLSRIFKYSTTAISIVIALMVLIAITKALRKYKIQKQLKQQPTIRVQFTNTGKVNTQSESNEEFKDNEYITLRG